MSNGVRRQREDSHLESTLASVFRWLSHDHQATLTTLSSYHLSFALWHPVEERCASRSMLLFTHCSLPHITSNHLSSFLLIITLLTITTANLEVLLLQECILRKLYIKVNIEVSLELWVPELWHSLFRDAFHTIWGEKEPSLEMLLQLMCWCGGVAFSSPTWNEGEEQQDNPLPRDLPPWRTTLLVKMSTEWLWREDRPEQSLEL